MFKSIQAKLIFIVSLSILLFLILSLFVYRTTSKVIEHKIEKKVLNISTQISQQILKLVEINTHTLSGLSKMIQTPTHIDEILAKQYEVLTGFGHIFVVGTEGLLTNLSPFDPTLRGMDLSKTDYVSYVREEKKLFVSEPQAGFFGYEAIVIAIPIFFNPNSEESELLGVLCGTIKLDNSFTPLINLIEIEELKTKVLILTLVFLGIIILLIFFITRSISRPIAAMIREVQQVFDFIGGTTQNRKTPEGDQISILAAFLKAFIEYLQEMTTVATSISQGNLNLQVQPKSQHDVLGHAFAQMIQYLKEIAEVANKLAHGDLSQDVRPKSEKDVLGLAFKNMIFQLKTLVSQIRGNAEQIRGISQEILARSEEDLKIVEDIVSSAEETSSAMTDTKFSVEKVAENTQTLFSSTEEISSSIEEMFTSIQQVTCNLEKLSELAETTAVAMNQMVLAVEKIAKNAEDFQRFYHETAETAVQGQTAVQRVIGSIDKISQAVSSATYAIQNLESKSQEIGSILNVIDDITDQTTLLALNASILAAQAGDHGRGFAVVANEIKELANRVALSTKEITQIIKGVQQQSADAVHRIYEGNQEVDKGVKLVNLAGQALDHITSSARNSLSAATEITQAIQEQKEVTHKVVESVKKVTEQIFEINLATQEQEKGSSQILTAVEDVRGMAEQVRGATWEQTRAVSQVSLAMDEVKSRILENTSNANQSRQAAEDLFSQAEGLNKLIDRFTQSVSISKRVYTDEIIIGMSGALKGPLKGLGIELYRGSLAYLESINRAGGIRGRKMILKAYDDSYDPLFTVENTINLIEKDQILLLLNYVGTPTVTRALPLLRKYREGFIYLFFPFSGSQLMRQPPYDEFVFNLRASYDQETEGLVNNFVKAGKSRIAVFYQADAYGRNGWDGVKKALAKYNLKIVGGAPYQRGIQYSQDLKKEVDILKKGNPDVVICVGTYAACAAFIRDARDIDWNIPIANLSFVGADNLLNLLLEIGRATGRDYTINLINSQVVPSYEDTSLPAVREYRELMDRYHPMPPEDLMEAGYQPPTKYNFVSFEGFLNAKLLVEILKRMRDTSDRACLKEATESLQNFDLGINTPVSFGPGKHQGLDKVYYTTVKNAKLVPYG